MRWHYSRQMPVGKLVTLGVWEHEKFVGVVIFGRGSNNNIARPFHMSQRQVCELIRIALTDHETTVTRIVSIALKILRRRSPGLRIVVSYADPAQGHHGGIYQGGNWAYLGAIKISPPPFMVLGKVVHARTISSRYGTSSLEWLRKYVDPETQRVPSMKHKYAMGLDREAKHLLAPMKIESRPGPGEVVW